VEPDQSDLPCPVPFAKTFPFLSKANHFISRAVSSHQRGGSRSSRTRDGMRWTWLAPLTNGADADGEVVWFSCPDAGIKLAEVIPLMTVANKPSHREEHEGNR